MVKNAMIFFLHKIPHTLCRFLFLFCIKYAKLYAEKDILYA